MSTSTLPPPHLYNPQTSSPLILHSIARLHAACITIDHTLATFLPPLSHDKILASWNEWSSQVEAGTRVIVVQLTAADSNEVAGVASLFMPETETGRHRSEVGRLLVSPDFRKRGLARGLMQVLEDVARDRGRWMVTLDTTVGSGAEHVYPKMGYKEIGVIPDYGFSPLDGSLVGGMLFYKDLRQG